MIHRNAFSGVENVISMFINKLRNGDLERLAKDLSRFREEQKELLREDHKEFHRLIQEYCVSMCNYYISQYKDI